MKSRHLSLMIPVLVAGIILSYAAGNSDTHALTGNDSVKTGQTLGISSIPNLRDMGGYETVNGDVIKKHLLYRSSQLSKISESDMIKLSDLNLKNSLDLRTEAERTDRPEELPAGVRYLILDVMADAEQASPAMLEKLLRDPVKANEKLGDGKAEGAFIQSYRQFVSLPSAQKAFSEMFRIISEEGQLPTLFHCTTGKDRTGWAAAAFLTLLGVPKEAVYEDYLKSNDYILPAYRKLIDSFVNAGGDENIPLAIIGVKKEYLDASFDEMEKSYGTIENYFSQALNIDAKMQAELKRIFLN